MTILQAARVVSPPKLKWDEKFHRTYTTTYQVITDKEGGPLEASVAQGIPAYGSSYAYEGEFDDWAFCKSVNINPVPTRINFGGQQAYKWLVTASHSSIPSDHNPNTTRDNPLDDEPVISGSFAGFSRPAWRDKDNKVLKNTAHDMYTPPEETDDSIDTLRISFNTATIDLAFRTQFRNTVNESAIWGLAARQAKLVRWDYQVLYAGLQFAYIKHDFEFHISYKENPGASFVSTGSADAGKFGWYTVLPNTGYRYLEGGDVTKRVPFMAEDQPEDDPQPLEDNGDQRSPALDFKYNIFKVLGEADFTTIPGMPNPLPGPFA